MKKECWEEAGVPKELAAQARPVGAVSYAAMQRAGLKRDVLFCYDLELPLDFVPTPQVCLQGAGVVGCSRCVAELVCMDGAESCGCWLACRVSGIPF